MLKVLFASLFLSLTVFSCPNFSGNYKRIDALGTKMSKMKAMKKAPIFPFSAHNRQDHYISDGDIVKIEQRGCHHFYLTYKSNNPLYITNKKTDKETTLVELNSNGSLKYNSNSLSYKYSRKVKSCHFGCLRTLKNTTIKIMKQDNFLSIHVKDSLIGTFGAIIPQAYKKKYTVMLQKI
ncbi:MAG: hypothetical protein N4A33_09935 [Bacteriovoracaceae bacterium]|jgi:uncharacterized CHY-type Zn-finger protein|nr:hypothetical protein [Bacteriovoracaceae bacterium]